MTCEILKAPFETACVSLASDVSYDSDRVNDICSCLLMEDSGREATSMREQDSYESADHAHTSFESTSGSITADSR